MRLESLTATNGTHRDRRRARPRRCPAIPGRPQMDLLLPHPRYRRPATGLPVGRSLPCRRRSHGFLHQVRDSTLMGCALDGVAGLVPGWLRDPEIGLFCSDECPRPIRPGPSLKLVSGVVSYRERCRSWSWCAGRGVQGAGRIAVALDWPQEVMHLRMNRPAGLLRSLCEPWSSQGTRDKAQTGTSW